MWHCLLNNLKDLLKVVCLSEIIASSRLVYLITCLIHKQNFLFRMDDIG